MISVPIIWQDKRWRLLTERPSLTEMDCHVAGSTAATRTRCSGFRVTGDGLRWSPVYRDESTVPERLRGGSTTDE
jgi:hypothetical protein